MIQAPLSAVTEIQAARERYLRRLLRVSAVLGFVALVIAAREARTFGQEEAPWFYLGLYVPVLVMAVFQRKLPFPLKTIILIGAFFSLAVHNLLFFGFSGAGIHLLLMICVVLTALLGQRAGLFSLAAGLASLAAVGFLMTTGAVHVDIDLNAISGQAISWITAAGVFLLLAGAGVLIPGELQRDLARNLETLEARSRELSAANARLEGEIAERRRAEEALRESEKRFRTLFEYAPDAYYISDPEGRFLDGNRAAEALIGEEREDLIGRTFAEAGVLPPEYLDSAMKLLQQSTQGLPTGPDELMLRRKDGEAVWVEILTLPLDMGGRRVILGLARDITERRRAEEENRRLELQLMRAQKMEAMGLMAGGVAHDLNNILSGIVNYPELLLTEHSLPPSAREDLETIHEAGQRAAAVVSDLLTIARGVAMGKEPMDLNKTVLEHMKSPEHADLARHHGEITVRLELADDLLPVKASATHVQKALMNLISNAFEAVDGKGEVTLSTANRYVDRAIQGDKRRRAGEYAVLTVSDSGPGIPEDVQKRIFEPFYTKKAMGRSGTGLGLAVVWNILQDHEGYVNVQSSGRGTTFDLYFPITREGLPESSRDLPSEDLRGRGERILVVDDDRAQRDIATRILKVFGYDVRAAASGEEAIACVRDREVDLVVLDMIMPPGMGGRETWERIQTIRPGMKAVIASGFSETEDVRAAQEAGAGAYVKKPYTLKGLGKAVRDELDEGKKGRQ